MKASFIKSINLFYMKNFLFLLLISFLSSCSSVFHLGPSRKVHTIQFENSKANSSFKFAYPDPKTDTNLIRLRTKYKLDEIVKNAKNDQEKVLLMLNWVRNRWEHNGWNDAKTNNACTILERAEKGEKFRCVEYGTVLKNTLLALGLQARQLSLMTKDVEIVKMGAGHVLSEVWLPDLQKWAMVDGQFNAMPVLDNIPLNAVELQAAIKGNKSFSFKNINGILSAKEHKK
jgi:Transglutaminase-like superfamily